MSQTYLAFIEHGYVSRVHIALEEELPALTSSGQTYVVVSEDVADTLTVTGGRVRYENGQFTFVQDGSVREHKWAQIKAARDASEFGGFVWDGSTFDSDAMSQSRIQGAVQLAQMAMSQGLPWLIEWTLADNSVRTLGAEQMIAVGVALGEHVATQHARARSRRLAIEQAQTALEISAVQW